MSFQAYRDNIEVKTGKTPAVKEDFELGHGRAMAIVALLKGSRKEGDRQGATHETSNHAAHPRCR